MPAYKRILLKLSGEALMGDDAYGINRATIVRMVREVQEVTALGCEVAVDRRNQRIKMIMPESVKIRNLYELALAHEVEIRRLDYKRDSLQDIFLKAMSTEK